MRARGLEATALRGLGLVAGKAEVYLLFEQIDTLDLDVDVVASLEDAAAFFTAEIAFTVVVVIEVIAQS